MSIEMVMKAIESGEVNDLLAGFRELVKEFYTPQLKASITEVLTKDMPAVLEELSSNFNKAQDIDLPETDRLLNSLAEVKFRRYKRYVDAGFSEDQAIQILIADQKSYESLTHVLVSNEN